MATMLDKIENKVTLLSYLSSMRKYTALIDNASKEGMQRQIHFN